MVIMQRSLQPSLFPEKLFVFSPQNYSDKIFGPEMTRKSCRAQNSIGQNCLQMRALEESEIYGHSEVLSVSHLPCSVRCQKVVKCHKMAKS